MLSFLITLILAILPALLTWWILKSFFPNLSEWIKVALLAAIILGFLRMFHSMTCEFLCGRFIP